MKSIVSFFNQLRSEGYSEGDALMQCVNLARTDLNVPVKGPDDPTTDDSRTGKPKLDAVLSLYRNAGLRGRQFREAISKVPGDTPFKNQQEIYEAITKAGLEDGSPEFADAFMILGGAHLPLKTK